MNKWRFEPMPLAEAERIHAMSRRALRAILRGDPSSAEARGYSFQVETYEERLTAERRLRWGWSPPPIDRSLIKPRSR